MANPGNTFFMWTARFNPGMRARARSKLCGPIARWSSHSAVTRKLRPDLCFPVLEVIGDTHGRNINVEPLVRREVGRRRSAAQAEVGHLGHPRPVFGADVKAGADFVCDTGAI